MVDVYKSPFGSKSRVYADAAPENRRGNCKGAIVLLRRANNRVYQWTSEIGDSTETRVRLEMTTVGVDVLKGDFRLELGGTETVGFGFSSPAHRGRLRQRLAAPS